MTPRIVVGEVYKTLLLPVFVQEKVLNDRFVSEGSAACKYTQPLGFVDSVESK